MNPELRRNLWLELTVHRMVALPIALGLAFMLAYVLNEDNPWPPVAATAAWLFAALALWGGIHAGDSVTGEVKARTWDGQRMSAMEPWAMTWGKLAGAPSFAWCGGVICLVVYLAGSPAPHAPKVAMFMVAAALLVHAVMLIGSVIAARKPVVRNSSTAWALVVALVIVGPWVAAFSAEGAEVAWWGRSRVRIDFLLASTLAFAAWGVLGAHRLLCQELRVRTAPWAWLAFLLFVCAYIAGFGIRAHDTPGQQRNVVLIAGFIVCLAAVYPLLLTEATGAMAVRRLALRFEARDWRRLAEETPLWPVTLVLAFVFCVLIVVLVGFRAAEEGPFRNLVLAPLPLLLLAVRDAAIYMFFALARQPRRAEAATLFYLMLLYWLVPMFFRAAGGDRLADLVLPPFWDRPGYAAVIAALQAAAVMGAALWRWRTNYGRR